MSKTLTALLIAAAVAITAAGLLASEHEGHERAHHEEGDRPGSAYLSDPRFGLYKAECGDCHLAYPPSLLPAASWEGMMGSLADHFGDNAELDAATAQEVTGFLAEQAAGEGRGEYGERSWRATRGRTPPLRISRTDYFLGQHHEIPAKMVTDNPEVGSFSRCEACHSEAERGDFSEHGVRIPGFGRWDD